MNRTKVTRESGYTLLQMAIALLVIGVLFSTFAGLYYQYRGQLKATETYANLETGISSISSFYANQGRVPCPASMTAARGDAAYGAASACTAGAIAAMAPGDCAGGICVEETIRGDLVGTDRRVIVGSVPFRDLQIPEEKSFDGYGSRLVYVVTMSATDTATYSNIRGAIAIRDTNGGSLTGLDGSALYAVISPGQTMVGAYGKDGGLAAPCPAGVGSPMDAENCNVGFQSGTAASAQSIYIAAEKTLAAGANFFDDELSYFANNSEPTWRRTTADQESIEDLSDNFVGAGTTVPGVDLDIVSTGATDSVRVYGQDRTDGRLLTNRICDDTGANCFDTLDIAGDNTIAGEGMKCPKAADPVDAIYMVGVQNGEPICANSIEIQCPAGQVLKGFVGTSPQCVAAPVVSCAATSVTLCPTSASPLVVALPNAAVGAFFPSAVGFVGPAGDDSCYRARYRCVGTTWTLNATQGTCKAGVVSAVAGVFAACRDFLGHSGNANAAGVQNFGWNNNVTRNTVSSCNAAGFTSQYDVSACSCRDNDTRAITNAACPAPYGGVNKRKITYTSRCELAPNPPAEPVAAADLVPRPDLGAAITPLTPRIHFGLNAGAPDDSACHCLDAEDWVFDHCPAGFKRKAAPTPAVFAAPAKAWPATATLGKFKRKNVDASCVVSYTPAAWDDTNCECDTSLTYTSNATTCADPVCEQPKTTMVAIAGYPGAGMRQDGHDVFEKSRDPGTGCSPTSTQIKTGVCQAKAFTWVESHTNGDSYVIPPANEVGKSCSCADHVATTASTVPCYRPADASKTMYFCKCQ